MTSLGLSVLSSMGGNPDPSRILEVQIGINWKGLLIAWDLLAIARTRSTLGSRGHGEGRTGDGNPKWRR